MSKILAIKFILQTLQDSYIVNCIIYTPEHINLNLIKLIIYFTVFRCEQLSTLRKKPTFVYIKYCLNLKNQFFYKNLTYLSHIVYNTVFYIILVKSFNLRNRFTFFGVDQVWQRKMICYPFVNQNKTQHNTERRVYKIGHEIITKKFLLHDLQLIATHNLID